MSGLRILARTAELGPLSLASLSAMVPVVAPAGVAIGLSGTSGLASLSAALQVVAGSLAEVDAAGALRDWLASLPSPTLLLALAERGVDLPGALIQIPIMGGDALETCALAVRQALAGDMTRTAVLYGETAAAEVARILIVSLPVYRTVRDAGLSAAAGSDPLVGLRRVLRVGS